MAEFKKYKLGDIADIRTSNVDKKITPNQKTVKLCNFVDVYHNWAISKNNYSGFMTATASDDEIAKFLLKKGQVAFTKDSETRNDIGVSTYIAEDFEDVVLGYHTALATPDERIVTGEYLNAFMHSSYIQKYFELNATGSGMRYTLSLQTLHDIPVLAPDLTTQHKIGTLLSNIDHKISVNREINRNLDELAKQIYDYWFVQFDFPNKEGKPYRSSGGKMVWNETLNRKIPDGWEVKKLGEVCNFRNGINYDKKIIGNKSYKIVNVRNISASSLFLNQNEFDIISLKSNQADNYLVSENSILIARSGCPGATRIIMNVDTNVIFCGFIICMENFHSDYKLYFAYCLKALENTSATTTGGSILQNVSQDTLKRISVIIPPNDIITAYNEKTLAIFKSQLSIQKEIEELSKLRDNLLPLLMNGQVTLNSCLSAD